VPVELLLGFLLFGSKNELAVRLGAVLTLLRLILSISVDELFKDDIAGECTKFSISPPVLVEPWAYDLVDSADIINEKCSKI
jgi:hypothetical protein